MIIRIVILGKIEELKETAELTRGLWDVLVLKSAWISNNNMLTVLLGKDTYEASEEERKEAQEKINSLPLHHQMLLTAYHCCRDVELAGYNGFYAEHNAQPLKKLYAREEQQEENYGSRAVAPTRPRVASGARETVGCQDDLNIQKGQM